ncbi:MAG: dephospho-CoA kinase [Pirellulales bacterium]|nr:dephospho-CoA kinase [Pirellulales bacterium]
MTSDTTPIADGSRRFLVIGLLGGVASGKSFVAEEFRRLGAVVLDADRAGHDVLRLPEVMQSVRQHFGDQVFDSNGQVDRRALGRLVFGDDAQASSNLRRLEEITHPPIGERLAAQVQAAAAGGAAAVILDAPVMLKAGWDRLCDKIVYIEAADEVRLERARARGWSDQEFRRREAAQESLDSKRSRSDAIIDNSRSADSTRVQVERLWQSLFP